MTKKKNPFKKNKHEILYNLINCLIAGALVFLGGLTTGEITSSQITLSLVAFLITFLTKFQKYWTSQENEYTVKLFNFMGV